MARSGAHARPLAGARPGAGDQPSGGTRGVGVCLVLRGRPLRPYSELADQALDVVVGEQRQRDRDLAELDTLRSAFGAPAQVLLDGEHGLVIEGSENI